MKLPLNYVALAVAMAIVPGGICKTPAAQVTDSSLNLSLRIADQKAVVTWFAANAAPYQLEFSPTLTEWTNCGSALTGGGTWLHVTNPVAGQSQGFYRVKRLFPATDDSAVFDPATGLLTVVGNDLDNVINVSRSGDEIVVIFGATPIPITGGTPTVLNTVLIQVLGRAGNDQITIMNGLPPVHLFGDSGNDTLIGGNAEDTLVGGPGNDTLRGQGGHDHLFGGDDDDTFQWNPGEGSDDIEGGDGLDTLAFFGAIITENIDISAVGPRLRLFRDIANVTLDADGVERVNVSASGGADNIVVNKLTGTSVTQVNVNLAGSGGIGDTQIDTVTINGTAGPDTFNFSADGAAVLATGLGTEIRVVNGESGYDRLAVNGVGSDVVTVNGSAVADTMNVLPNGPYMRVVVAGFNVGIDLAGSLSLFVNGLGGADLITGLNGLAAFGIPIQLDGGDDNDTILGGDAPEIIIGGPGNDFIDGNRGSDIAYLGEDDDTFQWDPGDGNDVVEGGPGHDRFLFNGANINENIDLSAIGQRLRFARDIANIIMDVDGVEQVDFNALGGTDNIVVNNLAATAVTQVNLNLATSLGAGDTTADVVTINGGGGKETFNVGADAEALTVTAAGREIRVTHAEINFDRLVINAMSNHVVNVNGSPFADTMSIEPNGAYARVSATGYPMPLDISGALTLSINGLDGTDSLVGYGNLDPLGMPIQMDGGEDDDAIYGSNGTETIIGGPGNDTIVALAGNDAIFMGDGEDIFYWYPGDGNDVIEGQVGADTLVVNGAAGGENIEFTTVGQRVHFTRDVDSVTLDMDGVERVDYVALGGADHVTVNNLAGTAVTQVNLDLAGTLGGTTGDSQPDAVTVNGTDAADTISVTGNAGSLAVFGLPALVWITHAESTGDSLTVNGLGGIDTLSAGPGVFLQIALTLNQD